MNCNIHLERLASAPDCRGFLKGAPRDPPGQLTSPGADHIRPHIAQVVFFNISCGNIETGIRVEFASTEKS